jgi:myxalamid-type polyketide synthase MxaE and MxaD
MLCDNTDQKAIAEPGGQRSREPIAIIGIGCRFPGVVGPEELWKLLEAGGSVVDEIPGDRFGDLARLFDPRPATPGKMMSRFGGFLKNIELFDADFFGIAPLEAERMDPQQRILLEVAWEALEQAGIPAGRLSGTSAGVFIGSWLQDFETRLIGDPLADDLRNIDLYTTTGSGRYPLAGRISYFLGLQGPSLVVDTACSSSLVAIHLAC